jgi:Enoyl-CoA hydratase/isomerase
VTVSRDIAKQPDRIEAEDWSALGECPVWIGSAEDDPPRGVQAVLIGVDMVGELQCDRTDRFDVLLTPRTDAPAPWIFVAQPAAHAEALGSAIRSQPVASTLLIRILRLTETLPFDDALEIESLAYSTLLGGGEFRNWLAEQPARPAGETPLRDLVKVDRLSDRITLTLNDPDRDNAMSAQMRDALYEALVNALDDPTAPSVTLRGAGRCFSTGGYLPDFGTADDLAKAHFVRGLRSCTRTVRELGSRATAHVHGACIGSGLELMAAADRRIATSDSWFQLPELKMGLIPGAGGTVSIAHALGRHRTAWMALSGKRLNARQALRFGLVHEIAVR